MRSCTLRLPAPHAAAPFIGMGKLVPDTVVAKRTVSRGLSRDKLICPCTLWEEVSPHLCAPPVSEGLMAPARATGRGLRLGGTTPGLCSPKTPLLTTVPRPPITFGTTEHPTQTLTLVLTLALALTLT